MGQAITKLTSLTLREVKSYNIERRAEQIISKDKPTPAPKHPSTIKDLQRLEEENVSKENLLKKDEELNEFLKKVYVTSPDPAPPLERKINPDRPLPVKGPRDTSLTYGYSESEEAAVPEGKVSLKQALHFISNHQNDPKKYSNAWIASEHKISLTDTNDILEHFKMLSVRVQKKAVDPESLPAFERLQLKVKQMTVYNGPETKKDVISMFAKYFDKGTGAVVKEQDKKDPAGELEKVKGQSDLVIGDAQEIKDMKNEENLERAQDKTGLEHEFTVKKARKRNQENG